MSATLDFRGQVQETIRVAFLARLERYLELVDGSQSVEDHRKAVELLSRVGDLMPEKAENRSLPVVHINFGGGAGGMQVQVAQEVSHATTIDAVTRAPELELNQPVLEVSDPAALTPSLAMKRALHVNLDVEPLLLGVG